MARKGLARHTETGRGIYLTNWKQRNFPKTTKAVRKIVTNVPKFFKTLAKGIIRLK